MNVLVFGASGKVGRAVVDVLLARKHRVTAFIHTSKTALPAEVTLITGDIHDQAAVSAAINRANYHVVISTLGSWGTPNKDIVATGARHISQTMITHKLVRFVGLTGTAVHAAGDKPGLLDQMVYRLFGLLARRIQQDGEAAVQTMAASPLEWTFVRAPAITNAAAEAYQLRATSPRPWQTVSRLAVANALVDLAEQGSYSRQAPFIGPTDT